MSHFKLIDDFAEAAYCSVLIATGRTHQIRVHALHAGHPLAGDEKYGQREFNRSMRSHGLKRLFLHAAQFEFALGERAYSFSAALPPELRQVLDSLERNRSSS